MLIVWDDPKRLANIANHEVDFADLDETFFENAVITPAKFDRLAAVGRHLTGIILVLLSTTVSGLTFLFGRVLTGR